MAKSEWGHRIVMTGTLNEYVEHVRRVAVEYMVIECETTVRFDDEFGCERVLDGSVVANVAACHTEFSCNKE
jgi:hypothetical protein